MRRDIYHYFQQALRRPPGVWANQPALVRAEDAAAVFRVHLDGPERIEAVEYRCTTCMTLVALCEHVAERLAGATRAEALALGPEEILTWHPEVPVSRHSRAYLAVEAARAAIRLSL